MAESWSEDTRELRKKAKIIYECSFLPEFFPEFPDKDNLSKAEMDKYYKKMMGILRAKCKGLKLSIKETNHLLVFFALNWNSLKSTKNPKTAYCWRRTEISRRDSRSLERLHCLLTTRKNFGTIIPMMMRQE